MRASKALVFSVVGVVAWGGLLVGAQAWSSPELPEVVYVPSATAGSGALYVRFARPDPTAEWSFVRNESVAIDFSTPKATEGGALRECVALIWVLGPTGTTSYSFVDTQTRHVVRRDVTVMRPWVGGQLHPTNISDFGPVLSPAWFDAPDVSFLWPQGQVFRVGQDLTHVLRDRFERAWALETPAARLDDFRASVQRVARVDDHAAWEIRQEGHVVFHVNSTLEGWDQRVPFLGQRVPKAAKVAFERSMWVSAAHALPLLVQDRLSVNGAPAPEALVSLADVVVGDGAIDWGDGWQSPQPSWPEIPIERSGQAKHPAPGRETGLAFPLAEALRLLDEHPGYAGARTWRLTHPDNYLISLSYLAPVGFFQGERYAYWTLIFATPNGEGYQVQVWPTMPSPSEEEQRLYEVRLKGPRPTPRFDPAILEGPFITIAHAERLWTAFATHEKATRGRTLPSIPGGIDWGLHESANGPPTNGVRGGLELLSTVRLRPVMATAATQAGIDARGCAANEFCVTVDARSGLIQSAGMVDIPFPHGTLIRLHSDNLPLDPPMAPATIQGAPLPGGLRPRDVFIGSTTALAILLAAVFYPLLKFLGAQGLVWLPGYAKLRTDDLTSNHVRNELLSLIRNDPGASASDLARHVTAGWSTVVYHLGVLERHKLVSSMIDTRHRRFFPVGQIGTGRRGQIATLRNTRTRSILDVITHTPGVGQQTLARRMGISVPGVGWHLRRLEQVGLVNRARKHGRFEYYAEPSNQDGTDSGGLAAAT